MTLQELGNIGEFVGSLLLLVSIIYLALQVRQNSQTLSNTAFLDAVRDGNKYEYAVLDNPKLRQVQIKGSNDLDSLTEEERSIFDTSWGIMLRNYTSVVMLENSGVLAKNEISKVYELSFGELNSPDMRRWWVENRSSIAFAELRERIDTEIFCQDDS